MATPTTLGAILADNVAGERAARGLQQSDLADRMRSLGWKWVRQTVGEVERGGRRLTAEELFGLAICLETTLQRLLEPPPRDEWVQLPSGESVAPGVLTDVARGRVPGDLSWYKNVMAKTGRSGAALAFEAKWPDDSES
jgi:transcriptional regulator with XRE-family HTH domain